MYSKATGAGLSCFPLIAMHAQRNHLPGATLNAQPLPTASASAHLPSLVLQRIENMNPLPFLSHAVAGPLVFLSALLQDYAAATAQSEESNVLAMSATASTITVAKDIRHAKP